MSDSVKGAEVEDVLSSVRRLISNDHRRRRPAPDPTEEPVEADGRLLLTPSDRVETPEIDAAPSYEDALAFEEHGGSLEERIAELEAAISERPDEFEPDGSEDQAEHRPTSMVISRGVGANRPLRLSRISLIQPSAPTEDADVADESIPDEQPAAADTVDQRADSGDAEADTGSDGMDAATDDPAADAALIADAEIAELPVEAPDLSPDVSAEVEDTVEDIVAPDPTDAPDTAVAVAEPDAASDVEDAEFTDVDPDEEPAERPARQRTAERMRELYADEMDDALLDDEALRGLVSALIRDELQGELGERITRNVRKLVRREIQRALAARDLH